MRRNLLCWTTAAALLALAPATIPPVRGTFAASTTNGVNTLSAYSTFPDYPTSVRADAPYFYHRLDEARSSSTTAADTSPAGTSAGQYSGRTDGPATWYDFRDISGTAVADASGNGNSGTISGAVAVAAGGRPDVALSFGGSADYVAATSAGISPTTDFTVSAWVHLGAGSDDQDRTVVSLPGSVATSFLLKFDDSDNRWEFEMTQSNVAAPVLDVAKSAGAPALDAWTHLAGVYDDNASLLTLYVNGVTSGTTAAHADASEWTPTGSLQIGRTRYNSAWAAAYWKGRIDDVRVYQSALSPADITAMAAEVPTVQYDFDEGTGATAVDGSGAANNGAYTAPGNTPGWLTPGHRGSAINLDGVDDYVASTSRAVATDDAFTVSAWVYLSTAAAGAQNRVFLSENGTNAPQFEVRWTSISNRWELVIWNSDNYSSSTLGLNLASAATSVKDSWQMVTAVYDDPGNMVYLYVNGVMSSSSVRFDFSEWSSTNPLQIGRSRSGTGTFGGYFQGGIDDVRTFSTALTATQVSQLYYYGRPTLTGLTAGGTGALQGPIRGQSGHTAVAFNGSGTGWNPQSFTNPATLSIECWFKQSGTGGGEIMAFNSTTNSLETFANTDRLLYLDSNQALVFGVNAATISYGGSTTLWSTWHHVVATLSAANGMRLYLDGALVASNPAMTSGANYAGYWRWGGGHLQGWPNRPAHDYFVGMIDEVAYYPSELTAFQVARHWNANR